MFEGKEVHGTLVVLRGISKLPINDRVLRHDSIVHMEIEARVVDVAHPVDEKTGNMNRVHVLRPIEAEITPWDPDDPNDDGVMSG